MSDLPKPMMLHAANWAIFSAILCGPASSFSQANPVVNLPFDPVMGMTFQPAQVAFELAPKIMVLAYTKPAPEYFWIYAQISRADGLYMVIAGPVWTVPDPLVPGKPVLDPIDSDGEVTLFNNGKCTPIGDPDTMFNAPKQAQSGIVSDLAKDLIQRAVRAYGGQSHFRAALKTQGLSTDKLDTILRPLIAQP